MFEIKNISKSFNKKIVVNNLSISMNENKIYGLLGPNGAGKTTTFYVIAGLIKSDSGKIIFENKDISEMPMHKRSLHGIKYLPQEPSIFQDLTVYENLYGLAELSYKTNNQIKEYVEKSIENFNLKTILNLKGRQLSGGQRRKVEIARTLVADPKIILLDEPFAGIDPIAVEDIQSILVNLKNSNIKVLITDHNVREALDICDESFVISEGKIIANGSKENLINDELVKKVYLGKMYN
jgi:lipopolysaccharide export system ATP-binding protein